MSVNVTEREASEVGEAAREVEWWLPSLKDTRLAVLAETRHRTGVLIARACRRRSSRHTDRAGG